MMARARTALAAAGCAWAMTWAVNRSLVAVRGPSMLPTLREGDLLLTVPTHLVEARAGRVVVVEDPNEPGHLVVKRLARWEHGRAVVLGDHPAASTDSRAWGPVPASALRRVALVRWPSLSRSGLGAG